MIGRPDERVFVKMELAFETEPDWDVLAVGLQRFRERLRGRMEAQRAEESDGTFILPIFIESQMQRFKMEGNRREEVSSDDAIAEFFAALREMSEDFFGCRVEFTELHPDFQHPEDMMLLDDAFNSNDVPFFERRHGATGDDIRPETRKNEGVLSPFEELDSLVGLDEVKDRVRGLAALVKEHGRDALPCLHMVFRGNPGTGKTTVARIIGRIFDEAGITDGKGIFVETDRAGLIGQYVGQTAPMTARQIKRAKGGVLFIDEAYSLGMYESERDYGAEAIATLVKALEDERDEFVCIMAGYPDEMDVMIGKNPGLQDRIGFYFDFPDYDASELMEVFVRFASADGYKATKGAKERMHAFLEHMVAAKGEDFSNARIVRKVYERVRMDHLLKVGGKSIKVESVDRAFESRDIARMGEGKAAGKTGFLS